MAVPLYVFLGFLEAGKTSFIQETLEDPDFNTGEKTLLVLCEDGEVEYEPQKFAGGNVAVLPVEGQQALTRQLLEDYTKKHRVDRVLVEYNGMWPIQILRDLKLPKTWGLYQAIHVVDGVARKLVYRHPHVFGDVQADTSQQVLANWDVLKRREKGQRSTADAVEAVPHTLPALWRAEKIQSKTAKAGFDWTSSLQALDKLEEEVRELRAALEAGQAADAPHGIREELGDTLFMAAKIAQMSGVDPEDALHRACDKFDRRFRAVEEAADKPLPECGEAELLALWNDAKSHDPS